MPRLRRSVLFASILGALALGAYGSAPASAVGSETAVASESPALSPCDLNAGRRYRCGRITVPAVRGDPSAGDQSIFFAVRTRDRAAKPPVGTIVAVEGGPGYASTNFDSAKSYRAVFGPLLRRRDLVLIDQRGTGHSQAVDCPQLQRGMVPELIAVGSCANQLGTRYEGFTSAESAADIEAVRTALGLGPITLYGDSYGTLLGQAYSVRYPSSLRSMVLSSAYPANDPFWRTIYPAAMRALKLSCARSSSCRATAASLCGKKRLRCAWDAEQRFRHALARIQRTGGPLNGTLAYLLEAGTWSPNSYLALNRAVTEYLAGKPDRLDHIAREGRPGDGDFHYFSTGMGTAVECNDYPVAWDRTADFAQRTAQLDQAMAAFSRRRLFAPLTVSQWMTLPATGLTGCLAWPPPTALMEPPVPAGATQPAGLPVLVLSGEFDDITTVREARQVARLYPSSRLRIVPDRGHVSDLYYPYRSPAVRWIRRFVAGH
ncbi:MAG: alpha/beta fold hydrolase [Solirubrobacterales bacterium]